MNSIDAMMRLDVELIGSWEPCHDPTEYVNRGWIGPPSEVLDMTKVPIIYRIWVAAHALPPKVARQLACWYAARAHPATSLKAIRVATLYALGRATKQELKAVDFAAYDAAEVAARRVALAADAAERRGNNDS